MRGYYCLLFIKTEFMYIFNVLIYFRIRNSLNERRSNSHYILQEFGEVRKNSIDFQIIKKM